jgi:hypothetical protein
MEIRSLYNGELEIHFDPIKHEYYLNGVTRVDGCTTILRVIAAPDLEDWKREKILSNVRESLSKPGRFDQKKLDDIFKEAKEAPERVRDAAAISGTSTHENIENVYKFGKNIEGAQDEALRETELFFKKLDELGLKMVDSERFVYSKKYNFCGTLDFLVEDKQGNLILGDIKTGRMLPKHYFQTAAYQGAFQEETKKVVKERLIIHVNPRYTEVHIGDDFEKDYECFLGALYISRRLEYFKNAKEKAKRA